MKLIIAIVFSIGYQKDLLLPASDKLAVICCTVPHITDEGDGTHGILMSEIQSKKRNLNIDPIYKFNIYIIDKLDTYKLLYLLPFG